MKDPTTTNGPRILTFDIETSPAKVFVFDLWNQNININQIIEPTRMICWAAKWRDSNKVLFMSEHHDSHEAMVQGLFELLDEADIVVTFNGDKFDIPHANREFAEARLGRPSPFHSVDLYKVVKKHQRFLSHKLAYVTERLALSGKLKHTGFQLWRDCLDGDERAWALMRRYNKRDVVTEEELYIELLPWIDNHPTYALFVEDDHALCPKCGSDQLQKRGFRTAQSRVYQQYQCQKCGGWSRGGTSVRGVDVR
jgi:DNA polymerase elongation subunit (family B)